MRLLLFLVSGVFSFIFYIFYLLSNGDKVFGENLKVGEISGIFGNLLIESAIFLALGIVFIIFFSPLNKNSKNIDRKIVCNILFYILLLCPLYFSIFDINKVIIILITIFIFGDVSFRVLSNIPDFAGVKLKLRYFGLALNYLVAISAITYLFLVDLSYYLLLISIFSAIFNFKIHKEYGNYISLILSVIITCLLLVCLFLLVRDIRFDLNLFS